MLSQEVQKVMELALKLARERRQEFATVEHLCIALFDSTRIHTLLSQIGINKNDLKKSFFDFIDNQIESLPQNAQVETVPSLGFQRVLKRAHIHTAGAGKTEVLAEHVLVSAFDEDDSVAVFLMQKAGLTRLDLVTVISHGGALTDGDPIIDDDSILSDIDDDAHDKQSAESPLARFTTNLTEQARLGYLDKLVGREQEIKRAILVLSRRQKNNPLFVGEPGVGKTALAEGIAVKIVDKEVPPYLENCEMYLLDMGTMLAGARYRGDFESRMKSVLKELLAKKNAIMVIDEIHTVIGAGATTGSSMDASNLLKPILAKGHVRCIGSTTYKEYRTYFEKDRALARRFQKVDIDEPSNEDCVKILSGIKSHYEDFHGVRISDQALRLAVILSQRFLHERKLPDKAIDLLDEACAAVKLSNNKEGPVIVDEKTIEETLANIAQIPSQNVKRDDRLLLANLENTLKNTVFGQDPAITQVTTSILLSRAGLRELDKPIGSFLFTGPSGVGKTEVAKQLALALGNSLVRFDMSEYMERHSASRLVGAPPGYVGFDQGGLLTDAINKTPYAVLLLDEIEKAHPDVFNMLLQVMDYGKLTDSFGRSTDFRHVILVMTSNLGARELEQHSIGFNASSGKKDDKAIKRLFSPEFRNRLDAVINFNPLSFDVVIKVVEKFIAELSDQLVEKSVTITITDQAKSHLAQAGYDRTMGARPMARIIQEQIKKPLAQELLFGRLKSGGSVNIDTINNTIALFYSP